MKMNLWVKGAASALVIGGALLGMAGPASALPGPVEDLYRDVVEPLPGQIDEAVENACETADCAGIQQDIANLQQGINEDIEFLTEELPCEQTGDCPTIEERIARLQDKAQRHRDETIALGQQIACALGFENSSCS